MYMVRLRASQAQIIVVFCSFQFLIFFAAPSFHTLYKKGVEKQGVNWLFTVYTGTGR